MTEPNTVDHWGALAGDLGAEPAPEKPQPTPATAEEPSAETSAAAPPPPIFKPAGKPARTEKRPARPPAWDQLAGDLGIEVPPPPVVSEPPASRAFGTKAPSPSAPLPEGEGSYRSRPAPPPEREGGYRSPSADRPEGKGSYRSASTGFAEGVEIKTPSPSAPLPEEEGGLAPAEIAAEIEAELTAWDDLDPTATEPRAFEPQEALDVMDETADEFEEDFAAEAAAPAGESTEQERDDRRGRHRRRRRGRGRNRDETETAEAGFTGPPKEQASGEQAERGEATAGHFGEGLDVKPAEAEPQEFGEQESEAIHDDMDESGDFEDEGDDEDGGESPRIGFRNIPTWQDAIGVMIAKNMESRARNPGGSRGPGGRGGGGRGRGGRGRGRDRDRGGRRPDRR